MRRMARFAFIRFLMSGGLNTAVTYVIYIGLLKFVSYQVSYTIAYVSGIAFSYILNRSFVFRNHRGTLSILLYPFVYLIQYVIGIALLWLCIDKASMSDVIAPLIVIATTMPITYSLSRIVFIKEGDSSRL